MKKQTNNRDKFSLKPTFQAYFLLFLFFPVISPTVSPKMVSPHCLSTLPTPCLSTMSQLTVSLQYTSKCKHCLSTIRLSVHTVSLQCFYTLSLDILFTHCLPALLLHAVSPSFAAVYLPVSTVCHSLSPYVFAIFYL